MTTQSRIPFVRSALPGIAWFIPYDRQVITTPLDEATVRSQLAQLVEQLNSAPARSWLSNKARYEGAIEGDVVTISGPIARRRVRLVARGSILRDPAGTAIDVTLCLAPSHLLGTLGQFAMMWAWALIVHFPLVLVLFLSCFLYIMTTALIKYEVGQIIERLVAAAGPPSHVGA